MSTGEKHELGHDSPRELLVAELASWKEAGPGVEPETAAMIGMILIMYESEKASSEQNKTAPTPILDLIEDAADSTIAKRQIRAPAGASMFRTSVVNYFRKRFAEDGKEFSDANRTSIEDWIDPVVLLMEDLTSEDSVTVGGLKTGMAFHNAATPAKSRYVPADVLSQLVAERFPERARGLDLGTSVMVGPLQIMHKKQFRQDFRMSEVTVEQPNKRHPTRLTERVNRLAARPPVFKSFVGVDVLPYYYEDIQKYDPGFAEYALMGLRPSERNDPAHFGTIRALMDKKQKGAWNYTPESGVTFHLGDLLVPEDLGAFKEEHPEPFDFIIANFVTQELALEDQIRMHAVLNDLTSENGIIAYIHQAYLPDPRRPTPTPITGLVHYDTYAMLPWRSNMHVVDKLNPHDRDGLQQVMTFHDNRCQIAKVGKGSLVVNGELVPVADLIKHS